jgi:hypothetical protein
MQKFFTRNRARRNFSEEKSELPRPVRTGRSAPLVGAFLLKPDSRCEGK